MYVCRLKVSRYTEYALITAFKKPSKPTYIATDIILSSRIHTLKEYC